jgi:hypothetical protein
MLPQLLGNFLQACQGLESIFPLTSPRSILIQSQLHRKFSKLIFINALIMFIEDFQFQSRRQTPHLWHYTYDVDVPVYIIYVGLIPFMYRYLPFNSYMKFFLLFAKALMPRRLIMIIISMKKERRKV